VDLDDPDGPHEPDQGNRYELVGVVAAVQVLAPLEELHPALTVVPLAAAGLGMVPVTPDLAAALTPAMIRAVPGTGTSGEPGSARRGPADLHTGPESGFTHLTPSVLAVLEALSAVAPVAYLEADYTGRDGSQTAAVWQGGVVVLGPLILGRSEVFVPQQAPISQVLRLLGVPGDWRRDEFVVAGLGRYRRTVDWT
jgi:hypothetical protein